MIIEIDIRSSEWSVRLDNIMRLQKAAYLIESRLIHYPNLPPLFETSQDLTNSGERFLIEQEDAEILGVLSFELTSNGFHDGFHIDRLVVDPPHFGTGVASRLLAALETLALNERQNHLTVSTAVLNEPAVRLYTKAGYVEVSRTTLADGLELVKFKKVLVN